MLVDAQVRHRRGGLPSTGSAAAANASCATGQEIPACRAASAGVIPRPATSIPACSRNRAVTRHRGGTCGTRSVNVLRPQPGASHFQRLLTHHTTTGLTAPADIPRPGQHGVVQAARGRPAVRARRRGRMTGDRPYLQRAVRQRLRISDLQALHAEQHRRRILEHDARGFLMISDSFGRPKIVKAAGSASRRHAVITPCHANRADTGPGTPSNALASLKVIMP